MLKNTRALAALAAAGAALAIPATGVAAKPDSAGKPKGKAKSCKPVQLPFQVSGTLQNVTLDDPATTGVNEATITLRVTSANRHARKSGELADQTATRKGVQVKGATYTVAATDAFTLKLNGFEGTDTPSVGDRVRVSGRIALTKKSCATAGTSTADRYAAPNVKTVTISDRDADV